MHFWLEIPRIFGKLNAGHPVFQSGKNLIGRQIRPQTVDLL
jgi:hypothetical protein